MKYTFKVSIRIIHVLTIFSNYWVHSIWKRFRHPCLPVFLSLCPFVRWNKDVRLRQVFPFSIRRVWVDFWVWVRSGKCGSERPRTPSIRRSVQHCDLNIPFAGTGSWDTLSVVVIGVIMHLSSDIVDFLVILWWTFWCVNMSPLTKINDEYDYQVNVKPHGPLVLIKMDHSFF